MDFETSMENLTGTCDHEYELTEAACGLLPAFKEILSWSRLYGDARLVASQQA